uniref:Uncharacterized protein n=1 Tax=Arundo donax TaxID=35708 RepID=A0A0A9CZK8_ARUDO
MHLLMAVKLSDAARNSYRLACSHGCYGVPHASHGGNGSGGPQAVGHGNTSPSARPRGLQACRRALGHDQQALRALVQAGW